VGLFDGGWGVVVWPPEFLTFLARSFFLFEIVVYGLGFFLQFLFFLGGKFVVFVDFFLFPFFGRGPFFSPFSWGYC